MRDGREHKLDLVCIGRTSVDLYAEQNGAKLEDVQSFRKYVGGSATNIAVGTARLGVKSAMLTRVGNEQMGRFVRRTLAETGVDVSHVTFDPEHLTPYVLLAIRDIDDFPRIFAYGDAADLALDEDDVDSEFFAATASEPLCNGFAIGRSIYGGLARRWLAGEMIDAELMSSVVEGYERMVSPWRKRTERRAEMSRTPGTTGP